MKTSNHQPAAPLPVRVREGYGSTLHLDASREGAGDPDLKPIADLGFHGVWGREENRQNADYIAHAANAYPKLVEALRQAMHQVAKAEDCRSIQALLVELGEVK